MLPDPPANLTEWLVLGGLLATAIEAARRRLVNPLLKAMYEHAEQHSLIMHELVPNGSESELPMNLRQKPIRKLAIRAVVMLEKNQQRWEEHDRYTQITVQQINLDRAARGISPITEPPQHEGAHE